MGDNEEHDSTIVTVSELIDSTFGDPDVNTVNHKQLQAVLYLLARQLRLLERKVTVKLKPTLLARHSSSSISVTEIKLKVGKTASQTKLDLGGKKAQKGSRGKNDRTTSSEPTSSDKPTSGKATSGEDKYSTKSKSLGDKASVGGTGTTSEKTSTGDKYSSVLTSSSDQKSSAATKSESGKRYAAVQNKDKSYDDDTTITTDFTSTVEKSSKAGKSVASGGKSFNQDKTISEGKLSPNDENESGNEPAAVGSKAALGGKASIRKSTPEDKDLSDEESKVRGEYTAESKVLSGEKSSTREKIISGGLSTVDDHISSNEEPDTGDKTITGEKSSTRDKTSAERKSSLSSDRTTPTGKLSSSGRTSTAGRRSSADKIPIAGEGGVGASFRTASGKSTNDKSGRPLKLVRKSSMTGTEDPQECQRILDEVEQMREKELRVIRQRADSREEHEKTPTPIASLDSVEAAYEKLLVVERLPAEEAAIRAERAKSGKIGAGPAVSVVTLDQFRILASKVHQIQQKLKPVGESSFPENIELMQELRKGASLTDAMAALQLSARLEATEKTLTNMLSLVSDIATQIPGFKPGASRGSTGTTRGNKDEIQVLFGAGAKDAIKQNGAKETTDKTDRAASPISASVGSVIMPVKTSTSNIEMKEGDMVTYEELEKKLKDVEKDIMKQVMSVTDKSITGAESAKKLISRLEQRIDTALALGNRMDELENLISNYSEQINVLDTGLSSQLTNYQEELTQMQHDLETGLENMAEVLANTGGDATAVAELNAHFNDLQIDIDDTVQRQNDLRQIQYGLSQDLDGLRKQIEMLRDAKSDRDEVADALRDKAGLGDLNGLISIQQFEAVIGDLEKRLVAAYDKFNNQEIVWQKAIDEVLRELNEKADVIQVDNLREQINHYLELLNKRMQFIMDIVGEPVAAALVRKINRGGACLSCSAPAHMNIEQTTIPNLPGLRPETVGAEVPKGDGDHGVCYPGHPIRHPIDPRAHICNRWCGGSHTRIDITQTRVPPSFTITPLNREVGLTQGTDGRMYVVGKTKEPCAQCLPQIPPPTVTPSASIQHEEVDFENPVDSSASLSLEMLPAMSAAAVEDRGENATPPIFDLQTSLCLK